MCPPISPTPPTPIHLPTHHSPVLTHSPPPSPSFPRSLPALQNIFALEVAYTQFRKLSQALFMRLTLLAAREASSHRLNTRGTSNCYRQCPRPAQMAAARTYYLLVAPEGGLVAPAANQVVLSAITPFAQTHKAYRTVRAGLQVIAREGGIYYDALVQGPRCA